jgi:hypothetical protein
MKIFVYYAGKPRDPHANGMAEEFIQRSTRSARRQMREIVPECFDPRAKHPSATNVLLDSGGQEMDSPRCARDPHANGMAEEFIQRSTRSARRQMREIVPAKRPSAPRFAKLVSQPELVARDRVFPIGGA